MKSPITLEDVLAVRYLGKWDWSPDGSTIAYIWDDGGLFDLYLVQPGHGAPLKLTSAKKRVSDFAWCPDGDLYIVQDDRLYRARLGKMPSQPGGSPALELLMESKSPIGGLSWSPDGSVLALAKDKKVWLWHKDGASLRELNLPGKIEPAGDGPEIVLWSHSSNRFAFAMRDEETYRQFGVAKPDGTVVWRSYSDVSVRSICWLDEETLYYGLPNKTGTTASFCTLSIPSEAGAGYRGKPVVLREVLGDGKGQIFMTTALPSPDRKKVLFLLEDDGWAHYYLLDRANGTALRQVTFGHCEDFAHAGDTAEWLPDSNGFLYASNMAAHGERHIYRHVLGSDGPDQQIIGLAGTNSLVRVSSVGRLAFLHCDEFRNMDLWVAGPNGESPTQVTLSMPPVFTAENQFRSEEVSYKSNGNLTIHGYLMRPKDIPPGKRVPAVVWVHGGPVRQMRAGWNPLRSYALFHGFNQYLVESGYVVLSVNYRGGIGFGRDFRQALFHKMGVDDVADVVGAANYLKGLPFVDPEKVAVWGLSYGGYMTLHSLTQYPDVFACGVNIAGIWDFPQWTKWAEKRYGKGGFSFKIYFGGEPELSPDLYRQGSPRTFAKNMKAPLLNVQGTGDLNVDFPQMDRIVEDLTELGKDFEVVYYPGEVHTFAQRSTWADAMPKIRLFLDRHLKL